MPTSSLTSVSPHQVRLSLRKSARVALMDLQTQAVAQGLRKPSYSDLIEVAIARIANVEVASLLRELDGGA